MIIEHSRITLIQGDIIAVPATGIQYGELALVKSKRKVSLAQVIRLRGDEVFSPGILPDPEVSQQVIRCAF